MTAMTTSTHTSATLRAGPLTALMIAIVAFASGLGVAWSTGSEAAAVQPSVGAQPTFDAVVFRADERRSRLPAPTFDAVQFRAEERPQ